MTYNINDVITVLSESTIDELFNICDFESIYIEDVDTKEPSKLKKIADKVGSAYVSGINKSSEAIAKTIIRKPKEGSSTEIQDKYKEKVMKAKAVIKVGEILVSKAILIGPLDLIATAALVGGIAKSDDPTDKMVVSKIKDLTDKASELKNKATNLFNKNKDKPITEEDLKSYNAINIQGMNIAKEMDATKSKVAKLEKDSQVTESVIFNKFDEYLIKEDGTIVDNACEILNIIVEKTDYEKFDMFNVVEHYINMII